MDETTRHVASTPRWLAWLGAACLIVTFILLGIAGYGALCTMFRPYDDEGYMLYTFRAFANHGGLYDQVYTQYGPFFYLFHQGLHLLGLPFTNDGARLLTLVFWLATSACCTAVVWRLTRSLAATVFTLLAVFLHTMTFVNEPTHPVGFITFMVAALALLGCRWCNQPGRLAAAAGAIGAALLLTKVNVGIFVFAGAGAWWLLHLEAAWAPRRLRIGLVAVLLGALPLALMASKLDTSWVAMFAIVAGMLAVGAAVATGHGAVPLARFGHLVPFVAAAAVVGLVGLGGVVWQGTAVRSLLEGILLGPLRHPGTFSLVADWRPGALTLACLSLAAALLAAACDGPGMRRLIAWGRLVVIAWLASVIVRGIDTRDFVFSHAVSLTWLFVFPVGSTGAIQPARAWLALLLAPQILHAYPVPGSHSNLSNFLWIPLAIAGAHEALQSLTAGWLTWRRTAGPLIVGAAVVLFSLREAVDYARYHVRPVRLRPAFDAPGASWLRLPARQATALQIMNLNARAHADMLFTAPGMMSFNLWTGVPQPTRFNSPQWFVHVSPERQDEIKVRLEQAPRSVVIIERELYEHARARNNATERGALVNWIKRAYAPAFAVGAYEFWVKQGRSVAPLGTAAIRNDAGKQVIAATLALPAEQVIAGVELHRLKGTDSEKISAWPAARLRATPLDPTGKATGPTRPLQEAPPGEGFFRLEFDPPDLPADLHESGAVLYFFDASGSRRLMARLVPETPMNRPSSPVP